MVSLIAGPISPWFWPAMAAICVVAVAIPGKIAGAVIDPPDRRRVRRAWVAVLGVLGAAALVVVVLCVWMSVGLLRDPFEDDRAPLTVTVFVVVGWPAMSIASFCGVALWRILQPRLPMT